MLVAVTGANGFIGKHLCRQLTKDGFKVRAIQRKKAPDVFNIKNLEEDNNWEDAFLDVDVIIHCASKVHDFGPPSLKSLDLYREINVKATKEIAIKAVQCNVRKFIFISSIKVNGEKTKLDRPFTNYTSPKPNDNYSISKLEAEDVLKSISKKSGIELVIIRPPLVYGPGVGANFLSLMKLIFLKIPLPFSLINNKRSFIYIGNFVCFITECIKNKSASGKILAVSDCQSISTQTLVRLIAKSLKIKTIFFPVPIFILKFLGIITRTNQKIDKITDSLELDTSETFEIMNWSPPYSIEKGIEITTKWFYSLSKKN
tara:strand:- start:38 stop:982 length:945 start_codon:yes stop_codon:yes gene_type:complete